MQAIEIKEENEKSSSEEPPPPPLLQEVPSVTALLSRQKESGQETPDSPLAFAANGVPPVFSKSLVIEPLTLSAFRKMLRKHRKSIDMKKLDCLGYFATRFTEIAYFEVAQPGVLVGALGFGSTHLVTQIPQQSVTPTQLPSVFELLAQQESFVGAMESLRAEDQAGFHQLGFNMSCCVGIFPVISEETVLGFWLCAAASLEEVPAKELKALKKILSKVHVVSDGWFW